jgi:Superfamily I DNA and RNA helicases
LALSEPNRTTRRTSAAGRLLMSDAETEERQRLARVQARLGEALKALDARVAHYADEVRAQTAHLSEARADMDHIEKIAQRQSIAQSLASGDNVAARRQRLARLQRSPYFGRLDFARHEAAVAASAEAVYVGTHHFRDETAQETLVYDWRAPIASLFYDYETGAAAFESPDGTVHGEIRRKRQMRIRDGRLEFVLESDVNVIDDVLQQELARTSDDGMRNIVATIQRDQNAIIRDEHAQVLIIQGVAGSGKTSIALHRIAFLLYRFRDTLRSRDILILSPNRVFADYIGNVLPELGEEAVEEIGMESLADTLLDGRYRFETFFEQTARLIESDDAELRRRTEFKASPEFLHTLDRYAAHLEAEAIQAEDIPLRRRLVPGWFVAEQYARHRGVAVTERVARVVAAIEQNVAMHYRFDVTPEERRALREAVRGMVRRRSLREAYKGLFEWLGEPALFKAAPRGRLEYADVFPLIYLRLRLEGGTSPYAHVKHLLVDEMQDYSAVQYAVLKRVFTCKMTVLGDAQQSINPHSASDAATIQKMLTPAACVTLNRSYRATCEIMALAQRVLPNPALEVVPRHGEAPQIVAAASRAAEVQAVLTAVAEFVASEHRSLALICRTQKQAERWAKALIGAGHAPRLLGAGSGTFGSGITVCTGHFAKGLEFDRVIVPEVGAQHYRTPMDRHLLYVACTRAMHRLMLTHCDEITPFLAA